MFKANRVSQRKLYLDLPRRERERGSHAAGKAVLKKRSSTMIYAVDHNLYRRSKMQSESGSLVIAIFKRLQPDRKLRSACMFKPISERRYRCIGGKLQRESGENRMRETPRNFSDTEKAELGRRGAPRRRPSRHALSPASGGY